MQADRPFLIRVCLYAFFISILAYIQYYIARHESTQLILAYTALFLLYGFFIKCDIINWKEIIIVAIIARLSLFFGIPNLSDDFYRFIWDGQLLAEGINPFKHMPEFYMSSNLKVNGLTAELFELLNSKFYFTIYPPISQFVFWLSVKLNPTESFLTSVNIMRGTILLSEIGSIIIIKRLLTIHNLSTQRLLIYALNPLVILELTGNLHFEAIMVFFLLLSVYLFYNEKTKLSAIAIGASIATKLIPLMLLPIFFKKHEKYIKFYLIIALSLFLFFLPLLNEEFIHGISGSLSLFFRSFEFNGSLFFLLREIGFFIKGYDMVNTIGPVMSLIALLIILGISFLKVNNKTQLESIFILIMFIQLLFATTVHPWYIVPMIAFSCMTKFNFPILWSYLIFLTYTGYTPTGFNHPLGIIILEYTIIISCALVEIRNYLKNEKLQHV